MFSYHLVRTSPLVSARAILRPPNADTVPGLRHAECMTAMELGSPVFSPARLQVRNLAVFAAWEDEAALEGFLTSPGLGQQLAAGWHVRLDFLRRWGVVDELPDLPLEVGDQDPTLPVVAVTLARLKHSQLPRFIKWGKPVERLVKDDPGAWQGRTGIVPPTLGAMGYPDLGAL